MRDRCSRAARAPLPPVPGPRRRGAAARAASPRDDRRERRPRAGPRPRLPREPGRRRRIDGRAIPVAAACRRALGAAATPFAATAGEDYELRVTASPRERAPRSTRLAPRLGCRAHPDRPHRRGAARGAPCSTRAGGRCDSRRARIRPLPLSALAAAQAPANVDAWIASGSPSCSCASRRGDVPVDEALERLRALPFEDLGFARIDHHRGLRNGFGEVVFGQGKTPDEIVAIVERLAAAAGNVLVTRLAPDAAASLVGARCRRRRTTRARASRSARARPVEPLGGGTGARRGRGDGRSAGRRGGRDHGGVARAARRAALRRRRVRAPPPARRARAPVGRRRS